MSQISPRDAVLELGTHLKNAFRSLGSNPSNQAPRTETPSIPEETENTNNDAVHLSPALIEKNKHVEISALKKEIGNERSYIQQVLANKLSEYDLPMNTGLTIQSSLTGELVVQGPVVNSKLERISFDLNQDTNFIRAYQAVSKQRPTLEYVDNVSKLTKAYGQHNQVFDSIVSEKEEFNRLRDLTLRFQSLRSQADLKPAEETMASS
jgi:hypothetical protein